jgi:hypothetical protein
MTAVDPRLVAALREQLARRPPGANRVGWKVGAGARESVGGKFVVGNLTSATVLADGSRYESGGRDLHADVEVAVEIGEEEAISGYGVALEIVDLAGDDEGEAAVAANVFHRAVAFGPMGQALPTPPVARLIVNGEVRAEKTAPDDIRGRVGAASDILDALGDRLQRGDRVITGSIVQVPVGPAAEIVAEITELGRVRLSLA